MHNETERYRDTTHGLVGRYFQIQSSENLFQER